MNENSSPLFGDSDSEVGSSNSHWIILEATPKASTISLPLPQCLTDGFHPRIRAPFQVSQLQPQFGHASQPSGTVPAPPRQIRPQSVLHSDSMAAPIRTQQHVPSLSTQFHRIHTDDSSGLPAPGFQRPLPSSHSAAASTLDGTVLQFVHPESIGLSGLAEPTQSRVHPRHAPPHAEPQISRVRLAATSSIVIQLWLSFELAFSPFSPTLQQMQASVNHVEHRNRFLNQFAATTLIRYMTASLQFFRLCQALQLDLNSLSAWNIADVLIAGSMARRSDGSGPKTSIAIKAMRWCHKQLQISIFKEFFDPMISSFDKQKFPTDRRESLPMPLYVVMRWERRILQSNSTIKEIIILGGLLMLLWSGLRFGDIQRSHLETWQLDSTALRGLTWRSKTSNSATPFGICISGLLSKGTLAWIHRFLQTPDTIYSSLDISTIDFALPSFGDRDEPIWPPQAMPYGEALYFLRFFMKLPWSSSSTSQQLSADHYTIHGLKCTLLSWACQLGLSEEDRRQHGKHKPAQQSVSLYSRDDVVGSLRLQQQLITQIGQGWRPCTPLARGGQRPMVEPSFQMEGFRKDAGSLTWNFFRFDRMPSFAADEACHAFQPDAVDQDPSSEDSDSSASSASSSDSAHVDTATEAVAKKRRVQSSTETPTVFAFGLHRTTWHVMLPCSDENPTAPTWQGQAWKTACGRYLRSSNITIGDDLSVKDAHVLCSHVGCRKSFTCMDK